MMFLIEETLATGRNPVVGRGNQNPRTTFILQKRQKHHT